MVRIVGRRVGTVVGLVFTEIGRREAEDSGFRGGLSRVIERVAGWSRGVDPGGCVHWRGH